MNPIIKEQLKKVRCAVLPPYSDDTLTMTVLKGGKKAIQEELELGKMYAVRIDDSLVDPNSNWYQTIHGNWNGGVGLTEQFLIIKIENFVGKMVRVSAVSQENPMYKWDGFIPKSNIGIIGEVN